MGVGQREPQKQQSVGPVLPGSGPGFVTPTDGEFCSQQRWATKERACVIWSPWPRRHFLLVLCSGWAAHLCLEVFAHPQLGGDWQRGRKPRTESLSWQSALSHQANGYAFPSPGLHQHPVHVASTQLFLGCPKTPPVPLSSVII